MVPAVVKKKRVLRVGLVAALASGALFPRAGHAHPEVSPLLVNRYLSLIVVGGRVEFFVTLLYGALPATELRKGLDKNGDGRISEAERRQGQDVWKGRAGELARLALDGAPVPLGGATADLQLGPDTGAGAAPLVVEVYGAQPLPDGTRHLRLEPGWDPPKLGETELMVDLSSGWELVSSRQGSGPMERLSRYKYEGPRTSASQDRSVTFVVSSSATPARQPRFVLVTAVLGALAAVGLALEIARRRKK
jgi:hypothetical protein